VPYAVAVKWIAKPGQEEEVARCIRGLIAPTRAEAANLLYQPHRDPHDPRIIFIYEQYFDDAGYEAHLASPHVQALGVDDAFPRLEARHREFYTPIEPSA
jgi:(4S)-4-hydroxy-5-phosphonooxypentane-2,3-dione isomerase